MPTVITALAHENPRVIQPIGNNVFSHYRERLPAVRSLMKSGILVAVLAGASMLSLTACGGNSKAKADQAVQEVSGGVNPYLWRASLDTMSFLPLTSADPLGGVIIYDWKSYQDLPDERIKATVYILDTRLRADGLVVNVFRQTRQNGEWVDTTVDPDTGPQLENQILNRARQLRVSELE